MDQLRAQRNRDDSIISTTGFYFPLVSTGYVEQVTCSWNDATLRFELTVVQLEVIAHVLPSIIAAMNEEKRKIKSIQTLKSKLFTIPITDSFIKRKFGPNAFQVKSGESYVVSDTIHIWKNPFKKIESERLTALNGLAGVRPSQSIFPCGVYNVIGTSWFYRFQLCLRPLKVAEALEIIVNFTSLVVLAIADLHKVGIAHLDIRLENICFKSDGTAVLIDLDRSCEMTYLAKFLSSQWGNSEMYICPDKVWTAEKMDWRQLAIMILAILNGTDKAGYHQRPADFHHRFFEDLFNEGVYKDDLRRSWASNYVSASTGASS